MSTDLFRSLRDFLGWAFGEDWQRTYRSGWNAIRNYVIIHPLSFSQAALEELDQLLQMDPDPTGLGETLRDYFGVYYDPTVDGLTAIEWLRWVSRTLDKNIEEARRRRFFRPGPDMRTLQFPQEYSLGWLHRRDGEGPFRDDTEPGYRAESWEFLSEAIGGVTVPCAEQVSLYYIDELERALLSATASKLAGPRAVDVHRIEPGSVARRIDLSPLGALQAADLYDIHLRSTGITSNDLNRIEHLTGLRSLSFELTRVESAGLRYLRNLTALEVLAIARHRISDVGLSHLVGLTDLRYLALGDNPLTDGGLTHLKGCTHLEDLGLSGTHVGAGGLGWIRGMTALRRLDLGQTTLGDEGMRQLRQLGELQWLDIANTHITDAGISYLQELTALQRLDLIGTGITDVGVKRLRGLTKLRHLDLLGSEIGDTGLSYLHNLAELRWLTVSGPAMTMRGIAALREALPECLIGYSFEASAK